MGSRQEGDVTRILRAAEAGDAQAAAELLPLVYSELRRSARARMAKTPPGNTLQPTALVHEAYLRLIGKDDAKLGKSRGHFFAAAAQAMRDILVEQARRKKRQKRGGGRKRIDIDGADLAEVPLEPPAEDILALDEALQRLEQEQPRLVEVVKLRFFAGLTTRETAAALGISVPTVERDWRFARTLLYTHLAGSQARR
ncbi:MAG: sigma-70 family RNA polymerase sigma factor [Planctomycetes bacterium]|nr:sigma-70 family RNA polymerase sigma factor [Planctomycetota bacterium]